MSTAAHNPIAKELELDHDEWWTLFHQLRLSQAAAYEAEGGAVAVFRKERDADND